MIPCQRIGKERRESEEKKEREEGRGGREKGKGRRGGEKGRKENRERLLAPLG